MIPQSIVFYSFDTKRILTFNLHEAVSYEMRGVTECP